MPSASKLPRTVQGASRRATRNCLFAAAASKSCTIQATGSYSSTSVMHCTEVDSTRARSSSCSDRRELRLTPSISVSRACLASTGSRVLRASCACASRAASGVRSSWAASEMKRFSVSIAVARCASRSLKVSTSGRTSLGRSCTGSGVRSSPWRCATEARSLVTPCVRRHTTQPSANASSRKTTPAVTKLLPIHKRKSRASCWWERPTCTCTRPVESETAKTRQGCPSTTPASKPSRKSAFSGWAGASGERNSSRVPPTQTWKLSFSSPVSSSTRSLSCVREVSSPTSAGSDCTICEAVPRSIRSIQPASLPWM